MEYCQELDGKKINITGNFFGITIVDILENLLEGYSGKTILEIGCGILSDWHLYRLARSPVLGAHISRKEALVYGLDKGFEKVKRGLEFFKEKTKVIPVQGEIGNVDKIFEGKQFDAIISRYCLGQPTYQLNWNEMFKKLYPLTKLGGYHCHYALCTEPCCLEQKNLEETRFKVLHYFEKNDLIPYHNSSDWFQTLILKKSLI